MVLKATALVLVLQADAAPAASLSVTRVGPFTATPVDKPFDPFSCKGRMAPAERKIIDEAPSIEVDPSVPQEALNFDALEEGLLCSFAVSPDGRRSVVLLRTGTSSYSVLFFSRKRLVKAQRIHGPWMLHVKPGAYPPHLEQLAAGDAGFLFKFDRKTEAYRPVPYPYRPGSD